MSPADGGAGVTVGLGGDRTCIQHKDFGLAGAGGASKPVGEQIAFHGSAIGLRGAASEVVDVEGCQGGVLYQSEAERFSGGERTPELLLVAIFTGGQRHFSGVPMKRRILLVDDELAILLTLRAILEMNGFEVETANSGREAIGKLQNGGQYHMVITDLKMETETAGYDVIRAVKKLENSPAVAILTAFPSLGSGWKGEGADSMLVKPMNTEDLLRQIEVMLIQHEDHKQKLQRAALRANGNSGAKGAAKRAS